MSTTLIPNSAKKVNPAGVDLTVASLKCALFPSAASAQMVAGATLYSALTNELASGNGYSTGGNALSSMAWSGTTTQQITGNIAYWTSASFTFRYAVIYDTATSKIIEIVDFGSDQTVTAGSLGLAFDTNGMLQITSS